MPFRDTSLAEEERASGFTLCSFSRVTVGHTHLLFCAILRDKS